MKFVIIGGSSGSMDPIKDIVSALPMELNAAVLVVKHGAAGDPHLLGEIVRRFSTLPVAVVSEGLPIEAGRLYVAPSGFNTGIVSTKGGSASFMLESADVSGQPSPNIDFAMLTGSQTFAHDCISVILSGYLDDGTAGAQILEQYDGITIVQLPSEADVSAMPLNVIHRDSPEHILPSADIGSLLSDLCSDTWPEYVPAMVTTSRLTQV